MNETIKIILNRRSIRAYKQEQLKDDELQLILEAGIYAPSAINEQPWHISAVQNKELLNKINEACKEIVLKLPNHPAAERAKDPNFSIFYHAPALIIVSGSDKAIAPQADCVLAMENMFLAAASLEIGSCWINAVINLLNSESGKELRSELGIPEGFKTYSAGSFGYKAMEAASAPRKENMINVIK